MFGNKNAGLQETAMRVQLHPREKRVKKVKKSAALPIPRKGFEVLDQRETYFAVGSPIRWTL